MCTLVVLNEYIDGYPLVVAANRDERLDRESSAPESGAGFICPWDREKGGTWIGVAENGWFVGLTNQEDERHIVTAQSRGAVVLQCLLAGNHARAARVLKALNPVAYNPFNLVFGRPGAMFLCRFYAGRELELVPLAPGINVISNDCWGSLYQDKVQRTLAATCHIDPRSDVRTTRVKLFELLAHHDREDAANPFGALCVHDGDGGFFQTRSSSIITVSTGLDVEYWFSDGHPCQSRGMACVGRMTSPK